MLIIEDTFDKLFAFEDYEWFAFEFRLMWVRGGYLLNDTVPHLEEMPSAVIYRAGVLLDTGRSSELVNC